MKNDFLIALTQLAAERHLPREQVLEAIEVALASAFKKDTIAAEHNVSVRLNPNTGEVRVYLLKTVVEEVTNPRKEITLEEASKLKPDIQLGEILEQEAMPHHQASRIAAQTAKQVVLQRLREAERDLIYKEFEQRVDDIVSATVDQVEAGRVLLDTGRVVAVMPYEEQVPLERYRRGQRLKVYVVEVTRGAKGPEVIISRSHHSLVKRLFELEVPEVQSGMVEIKSIAREAGTRSKVAVAAHQQGVDPVGSCIGMRGNRIQNIVNELHGEKIDVVRWDKDVRVFIRNSLSPSEVAHVELNEDDHSAVVVVPERQLSLAIGREGQNARLAAKLTGWHLDIQSMSDWETMKAERQAVAVDAEEVPRETAPEEEPVTVEELLAQEAPEEQPQEEVAAQVTTSQEEAPVAEQEKLEEPPAPEEKPAGVVEELATSDEKAPVLAEEELVALEMEQSATEDEELKEEPEPIEIDEAVWKVPAINTGAGQIRFAEDIVGDFRGGREGRRKGRRSDKERRKGVKKSSGAKGV